MKCDTKIAQDEYTKKSLPATRAHSHCALRAQLALRAPRFARKFELAYGARFDRRAPEFLNVALRDPFFLALALRARSCALRIRLSLFLII